MVSYLQSHPIPVVLGPNETMFVSDHHHLLAGLGNSTHAGAEAYVGTGIAALAASPPNFSFLRICLVTWCLLWIRLADTSAR